jgi:hypothetical protein
MRIPVVAVALLAATIAGGQTTPPAGGRIIGRVVDPAGSALGGTKLAIRTKDPSAPWKRIQSGSTGTFDTGPLSPAAYTVLAARVGFNSRVFSGLVVRQSSTIDLGTIKLEIGGSDGPGVIADSFGMDNSPRPRAEGYLGLTTNCGAHVDSGKVSCPADSGSHLQLVADNGGLYLVARNDALFTVVVPTRGAAYSEPRVRIDGLFNGLDVVLHTKERREAHIYFTHDIDSDTPMVKLWYVLW